MFDILNMVTIPSVNSIIQTSEQKVLALFAMNPGKAFYTREISKVLSLSLGSTHLALLSLEKSNFLEAQFAGRTKLYSLITMGPIISAYRVLNTLLLLDPLVGNLRELSRRIVLYGSYADGRFSTDSDLDLLIVTEDGPSVSEAIEASKRKTGLDLRPLIMNQLEWMNLEQKSPEFLDELSHGLVLWDKPVEESRL